MTLNAPANFPALASDERGQSMSRRTTFQSEEELTSGVTGRKPTLQ
jgi:hypothetical protein